MATAAITQADLITADELSLLMDQVQMGVYDEDELALIAEALTQQEQFLIQATQKNSFSDKVSNFFNSSYVQYAALGVASVLALAALIGLVVFSVKKFRATKKDKQDIAQTEEEKGLLANYETVV
jgi:predicted transporter